MQEELSVAPPRPATASALSWLTMERALYGALLAVGLGIRLAGLGRAPLLAEELPTALAAWRGLQGQPAGASGYAPLLFDAQVILFALRSGALAVRLLPALAGAALVGLPWLVRDRLGRVGALTVTAFLALSPGWVYAGRTADGAVIAVALAALFLALGQRYLTAGARRDALWAAAALAAGLSAGAAIYTPLTAVGLLAALWWLRADPTRRERATDALRAAWRTGAPRVFAAALIALASALWLNPGGLGATADLAGDWVRGLAPGGQALPWYHALRALALYEPLMLLLAAIGAYHGLRRGRALEGALLLWLAYALLLGTALGQRDARWFLGPLLPLTLLAARGAQALHESTCAPCREDLGPLLLGLGLLAFSLLQFAYYTQRFDPLFALYGGFALAILILSLVGYAIWVRPEAARRAALLLAAAVLAAHCVRGTVALAYDRARDPWEPLLHRPTAASLAELEPLLERLSLERVSDEHLVDVLYEQDASPQVAWALREFPNARATARIGPLPEATVVITGPRQPEDAPVGYVGQPVAVWEEPATADDTWSYLLRWLLYRQPGPEAQREELWVWVRIPLDG